MIRYSIQFSYFSHSCIIFLYSFAINLILCSNKLFDTQNYRRKPGFYSNHFKMSYFSEMEGLTADGYQPIERPNGFLRKFVFDDSDEKASLSLLLQSEDVGFSLIQWCLLF